MHLQRLHQTLQMLQRNWKFLMHGTGIGTGIGSICFLDFTYGLYVGNDTQPLIKNDVDAMNQGHSRCEGGDRLGKRGPEGEQLSPLPSFKSSSLAACHRESWPNNRLVQGD